MFGRTRYLIVEKDHKGDDYRREDMYRRMADGYRNNNGIRMGDFRMDGDYKVNHIYDEGYRDGYENAWKDHERHMAEEGFRRTRYGW